MPRSTNPAIVHLYQGEPVSNGQLFFFESNTTTPKSVYADVGETVELSQPVRLDAGGREPNIFYSGSAKVRLLTESGEQVFERDPVGGESLLGNFSDFNIEIIYNLNDIVKGSDGEFYISLSNNNVGNDPTDDNGSNWRLIYFNYLVNDVAANGALLNRSVNQLTDSTTHKLPDTAGVKVGDLLQVTLPDEFTTETPLIEVFNISGEVILYSGGTDTDLRMDAGARTIGFLYVDSGQWRLIL